MTGTEGARRAPRRLRLLRPGRRHRPTPALRRPARRRSAGSCCWAPPTGCRCGAWPCPPSTPSPPRSAPSPSTTRPADVALDLPGVVARRPPPPRTSTASRCTSPSSSGCWAPPARARWRCSRSWSATRRADVVAALLDALWGGPETLIVVSTDLSHYHDQTTAQRLDAAHGGGHRGRRGTELGARRRLRRPPAARPAGGGRRRRACTSSCSTCAPRPTPPATRPGSWATAPSQCGERHPMTTEPTGRGALSTTPPASGCSTLARADRPPSTRRVRPSPARPGRPMPGERRRPGGRLRDPASRRPTARVHRLDRGRSARWPRTWPSTPTTPPSATRAFRRSPTTTAHHMTRRGLGARPLEPVQVERRDELAASICARASTGC